ncbi:hypothetical protein ANN_18283 [Periplaneta americana]|uniref:Uncharacterized protein n=1 Tax=Periplaneta americana TaxID=6978 RepID=A0ABQ8SPS5_PERAM|nr:hypothetical protein ANN_18283 [Periplaneta americana]
MAGLCEGGNESPSSLKAMKTTFKTAHHVDTKSSCILTELYYQCATYNIEFITLSSAVKKPPIFMVRVGSASCPLVVTITGEEAEIEGSYGLARSLWTSVPRKKSILSRLRTSHNIRDISPDGPFRRYVSSSSVSLEPLVILALRCAVVDGRGGGVLLLCFLNEVAILWAPRTTDSRIPLQHAEFLLPFHALITVVPQARYHEKIRMIKTKLVLKRSAAGSLGTRLYIYFQEPKVEFGPKVQQRVDKDKPFNVVIDASSSGKILRKRLRFHPYRLLLLQALKSEDKVLRRNICISMQTSIENDDELIRSVVFSDEATFHLSDITSESGDRKIRVPTWNLNTGLMCAVLPRKGHIEHRKVIDIHLRVFQLHNV